MKMGLVCILCSIKNLKTSFYWFFTNVSLLYGLPALLSTSSSVFHFMPVRFTLWDLSKQYLLEMCCSLLCLVCYYFLSVLLFWVRSKYMRTDLNQSLDRLSWPSVFLSVKYWSLSSNSVREYKVKSPSS